MKLYCASASPFVSKTRMAAQFVGAELECVMVTVPADPGDLLEFNPLGKIPSLVLDNGQAIYDNRPICRYLGREFGGLYPSDHATLTEAETYEALCDGIADAAVSYMYELRLRPEEKQHQPWLDNQWSKVSRGLKLAEKNLPKLGAEADIRAIALAAVLGYLDFRFTGKWRDMVPELVRWDEQFNKAHPELASLKPNG